MLNVVQNSRRICYVIHESAVVMVFQFLESTKVSKCWSDDDSFVFPFLCDVVTLVFEAKYGVIFRPFWRGMLSWRTPKAREIPSVEMCF